MSLQNFTAKFRLSIPGGSFLGDDILWIFKHCASLVDNLDSIDTETVKANMDLNAIDLLAPTIEKSEICAHCPLVTEQFLWLVKNFARGRRLLHTSHLLAIGPPFAEEGDLIYSIDGADVPFVVRRQANGDYMFLGEAILQEPLDYPKDVCKHVFYSECACHSCSGYRRYRQWRYARQGASFETLSLQ